MVVVVQFLTANDQAPGHEVGAGVLRLEIAVAPEMAQAVDHAGRPERNPGHLHGPDRQSDGAEQQHVDDQHQRRAPDRMPAVQMTLDPVVGRAVAELPECLGVLRLFAVQLRTLAHHGVQAACLRAVGVVLGFALGMVLAVDGHPLPGDHARAQPQPETEEVRRKRPQVQRAVGLAAVQEDGDARNGDVGGDQSVQQQLPPRQLPQAMGHPIHGEGPNRSEIQRHNRSLWQGGARWRRCLNFRRSAYKGLRQSPAIYSLLRQQVTASGSKRRQKIRPSHGAAATGAGTACRSRRRCTAHRPAPP